LIVTSRSIGGLFARAWQGLSQNQGRPAHAAVPARASNGLALVSRWLPAALGDAAKVPGGVGVAGGKIAAAVNRAYCLNFAPRFLKIDQTNSLAVFLRGPVPKILDLRGAPNERAD
jgi:hypothetical protein